jgi:RHS repeat-associated protein
MIKRINNLTNDSKIILDSTLTDLGQTSALYETEYITADKDTRVFAKVTMPTLQDNQNVTKTVFRLIVKNTPINILFKLIENDDMNLSTLVHTSIDHLSDVQLAQDANYFPTTLQSGAYTGLKVVEFDITELIKQKLDSGDNTISFRVVNDSNSNFELYNPRKCLDGEIITTDIICIDGMDEKFEFEQQQVGVAGIGNINLASGKLIFANEGFSTSCKKNPITVGINHNQNVKDEFGLVGYGWKLSFDYSIEKDNEVVVLKDSFNKHNYYRSLDKQEALDKYNIDAVDEIGDLYFNIVDFSYMLYDSSSTLNKVVITDKNGNKTFFDNLDVSSEYITRITKIVTSSGEVQMFIGTSNKVEQITNLEGGIVDISYNDDNLVESIDFVNEERCLKLIYDTANQLTDVKFCKIEMRPILNNTLIRVDVELTHAKYSYQSKKIYLATDMNTNLGTEYSYSATTGRITKVKEFLLGSTELGPDVDFDYQSGMTILRNYDGSSMFYYFDVYGQCKTKLDEEGKSVSYNYDVIEDGVSCNLVGESNVQINERNLIQNHSFDANDDLFASGTSGWKLSGGANSNIEVVDGGLYGSKCLFIDKGENDTVVIYQDLINPSISNHILEGFVKFKAKDDSLTLLNGNVKVESIVSYTTTETISVPGDGSSSNSMTLEEVTINHSDVKNYTNSIGESDWVEFTINNINIVDEDNLNVRIKMTLTGKAAEIYFDDLQLSYGDHRVRYNFVENGYMEYVYSNLKPVGFAFSDNCTSNDKTVVVGYSEEHSPILGNRVLRLIGSGTEEKTISKTIDMKGNAGEELILTGWGKGYITRNDDFGLQMKVTFKDGSDPEIYKFGFSENYTNWQVLTRSIYMEKAYSSVEITAFYRGVKTVYLDALQLYRDSFGKIYNYDDKGNLIDLMSTDAQSSGIQYDEKNKVQEVTDESGDTIKYTFNSIGKLNGIQDDNGNNVTFNYDSNGFKSGASVLTKDGKVFESSQVLDDRGNAITQTDEKGDVITNEYDSKDRIVKETLPNGLVTEYDYNAYDELVSKISKLGTDEFSGSYLYNDAGQVTQMIAGNGAKYDFEYDDWGKVDRIKVDDQIFAEYKYEKVLYGVNTGKVTKQIFGSEINASYFEFEYDTKLRLSAVKFDGAYVTKYEYDQFDNISVVEDLSNNIKKYCSYNSKGKLSKITTSENNSISYEFDNLDSIQKATYNINDVIRSYDFEYKYEYNEYNLSGYFNRLDKVFVEDIVKGDRSYKGIYGSKNLIDTTSYKTDSDLGIKVKQVKDSDDCLVYGLDKVNKDRDFYKSNVFTSRSNFETNFLYQKTAYMWIKPTGTFAEDTILSFNDGITQKYSLKANNTGKLALLSHENSTQSTGITTVGTLKLNEWNLVGLQLSQNYPTLTARIVLNSEVVSGLVSPRTVKDITNVSVRKYEIYSGSSSSSGDGSTTIPTLDLQFDFAMLAIGAYRHTQETFNAIYREGIKYFGTNKITQSIGVSYYNHDVYDGFDVVTLNGTLTSNKGVKPAEYNFGDSSYKIDKVKLFEYDSKVDVGDNQAMEKHVYASYDSTVGLTTGTTNRLGYKFSLGDSGTLVTRVKPISTGGTVTRRYIFANFKDSICKLGLFFDGSNILHIVVNGVTYSTTRSVTLDSWQQVALSWNTTSVSLKINDGNLYTRSISVSTSGATTYVGHTLSNEVQYHHLNGKMEMLAYTDTKALSSKLNGIFNDGKSIVVRSNFDELGRVNSKEVIVGTVSFTKEIEYEKTVTNKETTRVKKEVDYKGDYIVYEHDSMNNVTMRSEFNSSDILLLKREYAYDALSRLKTEVEKDGSNMVLSSIEYNYDKNNNITEKMYFEPSGQMSKKDLYNYDLTIKDRLNSITHNMYSYGQVTSTTTTNLEYNDLFMGNPSRITQDTNVIDLIWKGRRLVNTNQVEYKYDENGQRIFKGTTLDNTKYILEGDNVVSLTRNCTYQGASRNIVFDFVRNESGNLVGFHMENKQYFYNRDKQENILNIMDTTGQCMVKYTYDSWGKPTVHIPTNLSSTKLNEAEMIAEFNPYMFKGYIYDKETGMYYLKTRYYSPELSRFVNADGQVGEPGKLDGQNLFAYCQNNPINYGDENGEWPKWATKVLIGVAVIAVLAIVVVATGGAGAGLVVCIAQSALTGAIQGAIAGAISGAIIGGAIGGITEGLRTGTWEGALKGALSGAIDGAADGFMMGAIGGAIFGGINYKYCFVAGTLILTNQGLKAIENIAESDKVLSVNTETGLRGYKEVCSLTEVKVDTLIRIKTNNEEFHTTPDHPFFIKGEGWVLANDIVVGSSIKTLEGIESVEEVELISLESQTIVYNFEVESWHTYFIGDTQVLVHNGGCGNGVGGKGWKGDKVWRNNVKRVKDGGTITSLNGGVPTKQIAKELIEEAGGKILRTEGAHLFPNPHTYNHINYVVGKVRGAIKILFL